MLGNRIKNQVIPGAAVVKKNDALSTEQIESVTVIRHFVWARSGTYIRMSRLITPFWIEQRRTIQHYCRIE